MLIQRPQPPPAPLRLRSPTREEPRLLETVVVVHGTFAGPPEKEEDPCREAPIEKPENKEPEKPAWWRPGGEFCRRLEAALESAGSEARCWAHVGQLQQTMLGAPVERITEGAFTWSGKNSEIDRRKAAQELAKLLSRLESASKVSRFHVVAHSHGGNVAMEALRIGGGSFSKLGEVVCLGTPFLEWRANLATRVLARYNVPLFLVTLGSLAWIGYSLFALGERPHLLAIGILLSTLAGHYFYRGYLAREKALRRRVHTILLRKDGKVVDEAFGTLRKCLELTDRKSELRRELDCRLRLAGWRFSLPITGGLVDWAKPYRFLFEEMEALSGKPQVHPMPATGWGPYLRQLLDAPPFNYWKVFPLAAGLLGLLVAVPFFLIDLVWSCLSWVGRVIATELAIRAIRTLAETAGLGDDVLGEKVVGVAATPGRGSVAVEVPAAAVDEILAQASRGAGTSVSYLLANLEELTLENLKGSMAATFASLGHCSYYKDEQIIATIAQVIAGKRAVGGSSAGGSTATGARLRASIPSIRA